MLDIELACTYDDHPLQYLVNVPVLRTEISNLVAKYTMLEGGFTLPFFFDVVESQYRKVSLSP